MIPKGFDLNKISKLLSLQVDQVSCLECCKYYIAPATAPCSHTLCHTCWRKTRICPLCSVQIDRRAVKLNLPLQNFTEHVHILVDAYEKLFKTKLDEFMLDRSGGIESENDPTKNVKDWLASSENQFSAPVIHSEELSQDVKQTLNEELSASKVQIHLHTKKMNSPKKIVHVPPLPQDDWDKIETMPDSEVVKNKENIVGPMDIEPYDVDDNEYSVNNPRRSSRKRDLMNNESNPKLQNISTDKHSCKDSVGEMDKKSNKTKQNWSNVKRMRKEFSKLNKKNKNKLNVSIELCKKTQNSSNKPDAMNPVAITQPIYEIDENTPSIVYTEQNNLCNSADKSKGINSSLKEKGQYMIFPEVLNEPITPKDILEDNITITDAINVTSNNNIQAVAKPTKNIEMPLSSSTKSNKNINDNLNTQTKPAKMLFFKKSALCPNQKDDKNNIETINHYIDSKSISEGTDDIEISIKIGNTMTNIFIKKKKSDVQLKVNTDREIQTSLGPHKLFNYSNITPSEDTNVQNIKINLETNDNKLPVEEDPKKHRDKVIIHPVKNKSTSTKKNTASADTATAQFEITESVEKELSNIMECEEQDNEQSHSKNRNNLKQTSQVILAKNNDINMSDVEHAELLNDLDIFESDSVKEPNVKLLNTTKNTPSEILVSTVHTKSKTQKKTADKREREVNDDEEVQSNKRIKIYSEKTCKQIELNDTSMHQNKQIDSEPLNYDVIMDQVFANIDADIKDIRKSQDTMKNTCNIKNTETELSIIENEIHREEIISETQKSKPVVSSSVKIDCTLNIKDYYDHKESENVFSFLDKDNSNCDASKRNNEVAASVQQHIDDLLTPVMCRNLESSHECSLQPDDKNYDSDKSIVEETPQKNHSFTKMKQKNMNISSKEFDTHTQNNNAERKVSLPEKISIDATNEKSIINLTDTAESNGTKDVTVVNTVTKKQTMETPLTINKFVDQIKHKSTPVARKSLNFDDENAGDDPEQTLCPTMEPVAKNTQEKEFMCKAFEKTPSTPAAKHLAMRNISVMESKKFCIAGSCLTNGELTKLRHLCSERKWTYVDKYTKDITHLVVGVDEEKKSQRSVKYMCALAAGKWIVSYEWVERCLRSKKYVDEVHYEALDSTGEPGPRRSRVAKQKLFHGITFFCMPPFSVLDVDALKGMLEAAGGRVVSEAKQVRVTDQTQGPAILLAEPENTQEDRFIYLAMELSIVPINFEWVLNCLGCYTLSSIHELLLCPSTLLPAATSRWPPSLIAREYDD